MFHDNLLQALLIFLVFGSQIYVETVGIGAKFADGLGHLNRASRSVFEADGKAM